MATRRQRSKSGRSRSARQLMAAIDSEYRSNSRTGYSFGHDRGEMDRRLTVVLAIAEYRIELHHLRNPASSTIVNKAKTRIALPTADFNEHGCTGCLAIALRGLTLRMITWAIQDPSTQPVQRTASAVVVRYAVSSVL